MNYQFKENKMKEHLAGYESPAGFRSTYKAVPYQFYGLLKPYIDFTKYYVMFRGPRNRGASSTRKRDAKAFDVYQRDNRTVRELRIEREAFVRGVKWAVFNNE
jgi:hypothetical protein